jgi:hypothetical protein
LNVREVKDGRKSKAGFENKGREENERTERVVIQGVTAYAAHFISGLTRIERRFALDFGFCAIICK